MDSPNGQLARIAEKLASLGLHLHPPAGRRELNEIEQRFGISLPDEYRAFLEQLGDGGAGPYHGIPRLLEALAGEPLALLQQECPLSYHRRDQERLNWSFEDLRAGTMSVCRMEAPWNGRLVLIGEARGRVVYATTDDSAPAYFVRDESFPHWYERWLDDQLSDEPDPGFGFDNPDEEPEPPPIAEPLPDIPPGPLQQRLEDIRERLWDGSDPTAHSAYAPPADAKTLDAFEREHGIQLPGDYRAFVRYIQSGGEGPGYGIIPLRFAIGDLTPKGSLTLAHFGRGRYAFLMLAGAERGRVFYLDLDRAGCRPRFARDASFLDWYERWQREGRGDMNFGLDGPLK